MKQSLQDKREDRAVEAIITAILRGWTQKDWERCLTLKRKCKRKGKI